MRSGVTRVVGFVPAYFQLHVLFHSRLKVRHGIDRRTDRHTTAINAMPYPLGAGSQKLMSAYNIETAEDVTDAK